MFSTVDYLAGGQFRASSSRAGEPQRFSAMRCLDVVVAGLALLFLLPLMVVVGVLVFCADGAPPIYRQLRVGEGGKTFFCLKFRSMTVDADVRLACLLAESEEARLEWARDHKLKRDPRVTALGGFLRRSSLDELPQFWNVLAGEMSLVGPRPVVPAETPRYGPRFSAYCAVKPGITGLWQVSGRNDVSYRRRVACDVLYARRRSLGLYLMILLATIPAVLSARGSC